MMSLSTRPDTCPKIKISCYIITQNEEERLERTLKAARQVADEIIIVDSGSTDNTLSIANQFADKVVHHDWQSYSEQKHFAQNQCSHDWLLSLDADEVLSPQLIQEILTLKQKEPPFKAYQMKIRNVLPNRQKPYPWAKEYNIIRLYHKNYAAMSPHLLTEDRIHLTQNVPLGQLKAYCCHFSYLNLSQTITKLNNYTNDCVETVKNKGKRYSLARFVLEFPYQFLRCYLIDLNILNGRYGFIIACNTAYFRWVKIAKTIESQLSQSLVKES